VFTLDQTADAARAVQRNESEGKLGVLCLSPEEGLGVTDVELREKHIDQITLFRRFEEA
jgi:crotonyl-CoA reductase